MLRLLTERYRHSQFHHFYVFTILCIVSGNVTSDTLRSLPSSVESFSIQHGLIDNTIYSMQKDDRGYLWLGTPNGLSRFDGHRFTNFTTDSIDTISLTHRGAANILIDSKQRIWVGTWGNGLYLYNPDLTLIMHYKDPSEQALAGNLVQTVYEDSDGDIWVGTNGGGLWLIPDGTGEARRFTSDKLDEQTLSSNRVWNILEGQSGRIWIATGTGLDLVNKHDNYTILRHQKIINEGDDVTNFPVIRSLYFDKHRKLWIGTDVGLFEFDKENLGLKALPLNAEKIDLNSGISSLEAGKNDELWVGTQSGLFLFNTATRKFIPLVSNDQFELISHYDIRSLLFDEADVLWVASRASGLVKISFGKKPVQRITQFKAEDGTLKNIDRVGYLFADNKQNLWIASTQGLFVKREENDHPILFDGHIEQGILDTITEGIDGTLWFGGNKGLFKLAPSSDVLKSANDLFTSIDTEFIVSSLLADSKGNLWAGTNNKGLFRLKGQAFKSVDIKANEVTGIGSIQSIIQDQRGYIWLGTSGIGAYRFSRDLTDIDEYQYNAKNDDSLSNNYIVQILRTSNNHIWIGTNFKLNKLDQISNTFERYGKLNGFENTNIKSVVEDKYQNLWVSTTSGIYRQNNNDERFVSYMPQGDQFANEFTSRASASLGNALYFGTSVGIIRIDISQKVATQRNRKIAISGIQVDKKNYPQLNFDNKNKLYFNKDTKDLVFYFSNFNFLSSQSTSYSHRLVGYSDKWSLANHDNSVAFSGLAAGNYSFEVKASNHKGDWLSDVAIVKFKIVPPWWQTITAKVILLLLTVLIAHFWNRYRIRNLALENQKLEDTVKERTSELLVVEKRLVEAKKNSSLSSLVKGVAHEINTPLGASITASTLLVAKSKKLIEQLETNVIKKSDFIATLSDVREGAELINKCLFKASELITSFKSVSVDEISEKKRVFNLKDYLYEISVTLAPLMQENNINLCISCPENIIVDSYPDAIAQLFNQLVLNSTNHAFSDKEGGKINIDISQEKNRILFNFSDDGKGIPEDIIERVFEPFFTTKRNLGSKGLGLQIVANIVTIRLLGKVTCSSVEGKGTRFDIEFIANHS